MEIKLNDAKKVAKELNDFLGLAPAIDVKAPIDVLLAKIGLAVELLEDGELEELTEVTQQVVTVIQNQKNKEEGDEEEEEEEKPVTNQKVGKKKEIPSNKSIVWDFFKKSKITKKEQVTEVLYKEAAALVPAVQVNTVKGWLRSWTEGKNLPACASK